MENAKRLLNVGEQLVRWAKILLWLLALGVAGVFFTVCFSGEYAPEYLGLSGPYFGINLLVLLWYLLIAGGISLPLFCFGLGMILVGLGQIAWNTSSSATEEVSFAPVSDLPPVKPSTGETKHTASLALINSLGHALSTTFDEEMVSRLSAAKQRLTNPYEKQLIQQVLNAPGGQVRQVAQRLYASIKR